MNIFYLDHDPVIAATYLCDKHMKMCLETAQILSTVSWRYNILAPYKPTHKNHPAVLWAGETIDNWNWTVKHGLAISNEYTIRYGKVHKSEAVIKWCQEYGGRPEKLGFTSPGLCMPEVYKTNDPVESYRSYYKNDKAKIAKWNKTKKPSWYTV